MTITPTAASLITPSKPQKTDANAPLNSENIAQTAQAVLGSTNSAPAPVASCAADLLPLEKVCRVKVDDVTKLHIMAFLYPLIESSSALGQKLQRLSTTKNEDSFLVLNKAELDEFVSHLEGVATATLYEFAEAIKYAPFFSPARLDKMPPPVYIPEAEEVKQCFQSQSPRKYRSLKEAVHPSYFPIGAMGKRCFVFPKDAHYAYMIGGLFAKQAPDGSIVFHPTARWRMVGGKFERYSVAPPAPK